MQPIEGELYMIDEMVDDLNGDKLLDGCRNAAFNPFYHLLASPAETVEQNNYRNLSNLPSIIEKAQEFTQFVASLEGKNAPTFCQQEVIGSHLGERLFLVQGPPGTGKSHTISWAVLSRMYAALQNNATLRVAVSCQTHNAVNIVLESIVAKLRRLQDAPDFDQSLFQSLQIFKIVNSDDASPDLENRTAIEPLDIWQQRFRLGQILGSRIVVIGGTPGGLYKLMNQKKDKRGAPEVLWQEKPFDLLILDEASQMNLPQAVLASSWLQENGQMIVVGDHRQMSPILAHVWDDEDRLSAVVTHPYRSVFQYLVDQKFPRVALDESFRLHRLQAAFLHQNIYRHDGILFHSRREHLLPFIDNPEFSDYLKAVMHPNYPLIVIEHNERGSQQANPTEADLISPVIRACLQYLELNGEEGIGVVVPHRAQKALLRERFPQLADASAIDTVERFQGDEREVIIVSATASDPDYVLAEAEFLLNPNRLNVALSRPRAKLIVVASSAVFKFLSKDLDIFEQAALWKRLLSRECASTLLWQGPQAGTQVRVWGSKA